MPRKFRVGFKTFRRIWTPDLPGVGTQRFSCAFGPGFWVLAYPASWSAGTRQALRSGLLFFIPPLQAINKQLQVEEDGATESRTAFSLPPRSCSGAERLQGRCLCYRVASVRDLLFSSQRLSNQYLISPFLSAREREKENGATEEKGPSTSQGSLSWFTPLKKRKRERGRESGREEGDTAGAGGIKTLEKGSDLWVIALLSTTHSRPIYSRRAQDDWSYCLRGRKRGWPREALMLSS